MEVVLTRRSSRKSASTMLTNGWGQLWRKARSWVGVAKVGAYQGQSHPPTTLLQLRHNSWCRSRCREHADHDVGNPLPLHEYRWWATPRPTRNWLVVKNLSVTLITASTPLLLIRCDQDIWDKVYNDEDLSPADCLWLEDIAQGNKTLKSKDGRSYTKEMKVCIMKLLDDNVSVCREGETIETLLNLTN